MRFFTMEQDRTLQDMIQFRDFDIAGPRHIFYKEDADDIDPSATLYLAAESGETAPDYIQFPVHMVSDTVKNVLDMYEDDMSSVQLSLPVKKMKCLRYTITCF